MTTPRRRPPPPPPAPPAPARAPVREVGGPSTRYKVELDPRPVFDFIVSLVHDEDDLGELQPEDRRWLTETRRGLSAEQKAIVDREHARSGPPNLAGVAVKRAEVRDAADLVQVMRDSDPLELARDLLAEQAAEAGLSDRLDAALSGDEAARAALARALGDGYSVALLEDPRSWVAELRVLLEQWLERYREVEPRVRRWLERDTADRRGDLRRLAAPEMVERTTGGIRFFAEPNVRRVLLAPSYFARPYNYIFAADDWRLFCYPIADDAIGGADRISPPPAAVRLYRALGDETRLRILKLLTERDHYLTELAQQLELSKPTIKHHLAQLRSAGLVTLTEAGSLTYYSLRRDRIADAGADVMRYLSD